MTTEYDQIKAAVRRGRPRNSDAQRERARRRAKIQSQAVTQARLRTALVFKHRYPEEYENIYREEYEALKRVKLEEFDAHPNI